VGLTSKVARHTWACLGIIQAKGALADSWHRFTFETQANALAQATGVAGKIGKSFFLRLSPRDQSEQTTASRAGVFHQFHRQAPIV